MPFCGCMGVALAEPARITTIAYGKHGGNMDVRDWRVGTTLCLPVFIDGALFACGDCHHGQEQAELCGTCIESPMIVTSRLDLRKDLAVDVAEIPVQASFLRGSWRM